MLRNIPVALLFCLSTFGLALGASLTQQPKSPSEHVRRFRHEDHVSESWSSQQAANDKRLQGRKAEVERDCLGCHDYRQDVSPGELARPADRCGRCHDPDGYWAQRPEEQKIDTSQARVDPAKGELRLFKHSSHLEDRDGKRLECAQCHYEDAGSADTPAWTIKLPGHNSENKSYCTTCHDNAKPAEQWTQEEHEARKFFNDGLSDEAKKRAKASGPRPALVFSHAAHLKLEELSTGGHGRCMECHASLANSRADSLADTQFDTNSCERCHNGMKFGRSGKLESGEALTVTSPTAGVFSHKQHLGQGSTKPGIKAVGPEGCFACHAFEAEATRAEGVRSFALQPFLQPSADTGAFQGCVKCHTEVKIDQHGNTDACSQCHVIDAKLLTKYSAFASNRPLEEVTRADPANFKFELQSHKFISKGSMQGAPSSCARCHKAQLELLPSRIEKQTFSHTTHVRGGFEQLQPAAKNAKCVKCHGEVVNSESMKDIPLAYDPSACVECHGSAGAIPTPEAHPRQQLFRFDHKKHVGKKNRHGTVVSCVDCHVTSGSDQSLEIVLASKVADCTLCHGHPAQAEAKLNRFDETYVKSCVMCHESGIPPRGEPVAVGRARLVVEDDGYQKHTGEARCVSCHVIHEQAFDANSRKKPVQIPNMISVTSTKPSMQTPHDAVIAMHKNKDATDAEKATIKYLWDRVSCVDCHWSRTGDLPDATVKNAAAAPSAKLRVKNLLADKDWRRTYRQPDKQGNFLGGPGTDYPEGFPGWALEKSK